MRGIRLQRISPAMVVAFVALIAALGQTAFAGPVAQLAKLVSGDKVIKKNSLSGSRLRNHTLTGTQINLAKLGTVPSATFAANAANASHASNADSATSASHANSADSATNASTSGDASTLQGNDASAFMHGRGRVIVGRRDLANGTATTTLVDIPGVGTLTTDCGPSGGGSLLFNNDSGTPEDLSFAFNNSAPAVVAVPDGNHYGVLGLTSGTTVQWQVATRGATPSVSEVIATYSASGPASCTTFAQATSSS
jgi:hypothetical protein